MGASAPFYFIVKNFDINEYKKYQGMMITLVIGLSAAVSCVVTIITIMLFFIGSKKKINWLLAGGINLSNVSKAIKITKTKGLDISSGVEISKGVKSPRLIRSFVNKCRNI